MHRWLELVLIIAFASSVARADSPRPKTCPTDFKHAAEGGKCAIGDTLPPPCAYPEGHCECAVPQICSGVMRPPLPISEAIWQCTPKVRPDGCPGDQPAVGGKCDANKLPSDGCWYGHCAANKLSCVAGVWKVTGTIGPPPSAPPSHPSSSPSAAHWMYRVYSSGIESNHESVVTFVLDETAGTMVSTERARDGRARAAWIDGTTTHWKLAVSRGADLGVTLTASDGTETRYACKPQMMDVAPATATRASAGGESGWKRGHWTVATRKVAVQVCRADGANPPELLLATDPIEHVKADDLCCGDSPSLRFVPKDSSIVAPRDKSFPQRN